MMQQVAEATAVAETEESPEADRAVSLDQGPMPQREKLQLERTSEVALFGAIKEKKHSLEAGIALFNRYPSASRSNM